MDRTITLEVDGLSFAYGGAKVWEDIGFTLSSGQVAVLTGPNGAGKSTLLRCLAGWATPRLGIIRVCGEEFGGADRQLRGRLALVCDAPSFYDDLTAWEHVWFVLRANRKDECEEYARDLLGRFGLSPYLGAYPSSFSRGCATSSRW